MPETLFRRVDRGPITSRVSEPRESRGRQDLITFCRAAGWKLAQLHDVDIVPCYHVNGRLNVLGRDKRVCSPTIYSSNDKFGAIDPAGTKAGRILSLDDTRPVLSLKFEDSSTTDTPALRTVNFYFYPPRTSCHRSQISDLCL